jgi:hypothetical protein
VARRSFGASGRGDPFWREYRDMKRLVTAATVAALLAGGVWLRAADKERTKDEIKELMKKTNKGDDSPMGKLSKELKSEEPSWPELQKQVKELSTLAAALGECKDIGKGGAAKYQKSVEALDAAAAKKDKGAAVEARTALLKSCASCHYGGAPNGTGGGRQ